MLSLRPRSVSQHFAADWGVEARHVGDKQCARCAADVHMLLLARVKMWLQPGLVCYALCYPRSRRLLSSALMRPGSVKPLQDCARTAEADEEEPGESPAVMLA